MSKKSWPEAPLDNDGNMGTFPYWHYQLKPVEPFEDILTYETYSRGRSAATMEMRRLKTNTIVPVFLSDFDEMVKLMQHGVIAGKFRYVKKGSNYGVALA